MKVVHCYFEEPSPFIASCGGIVERKRGGSFSDTLQHVIVMIVKNEIGFSIFWSLDPRPQSLMPTSFFRKPAVSEVDEPLETQWSSGRV
jgi:hypothetical protein